MRTELKPGMKVMRLAGHLGGWLPAETLKELIRVEEGGERWFAAHPTYEMSLIQCSIFILPGSLVEHNGIWFTWHLTRCPEKRP